MSELKNQTDLQQNIRCVSHEIRNYLSICDMYSTILERNIEKSDISDPTITNAITCIKKSLQIINSNLLDLKSINSEIPQNHNFETILNKAVDLANGYVFDKNINISLLVKNSGIINVDENRFLSCLVNIIKNGIESIQLQGEITIIAEIISKTGIIRIMNNGTPIKSDKQSKIFERGFTTKNSGCGLGLWMCKNYLKSQNATIELVKSNSKETVFEIKIPVI